MGNFDRFEKLDMLGELNEKYIREADGYLAEYSDTDMDFALSEPEQRKISWKMFTAAAAAFMVGAAVLVTVMIRKNLPETNDFITPEQHAYLEEVKEKLGTSLNVDYAVDKMNFTEIDLPDDLDVGGFIDENRALVIKEDPMTLEQTLEVYNVKDKTYTVIAQLGADGKHWIVDYADKDYIIYKSWSDDYNIGDEIYLYDVNEESSVLIYSKDTYYSVQYTPAPIIADGKVYFTVADRYVNPTQYCIHIYDIESKTELMTIGSAIQPMRYKDDVVYWYSPGFSSEIKGILSLSGQNDFLNGGYVYSTGNGLYSIDAWSKVTELASEREILPSRHAMTGTTQCRFACDFAVMYDLIDYETDPDTYVNFVYYEPTDEILVFRDGDGFYSFNNLGWGIYALKVEADGTRREFIITEEDSGNTVKIPRPDPDEHLDPSAFYSAPEDNMPDNAVFFADGKFVSLLPTVSFYDAFELEPIDTGAAEDDKIMNGYDAIEQQLGYSMLEINGQYMVLGDLFDIDHNIVRLVELYYGVEGARYEPPEWGYYDPRTREFTSLLKCSEDEVWNSVEVTDDYLIFQDAISGAYLLIEKSSLGGGEPNLIRIGEGLTKGKSEYVIGDDGMFYFNAFDADGSNWMYSYEFASGKLSRMIPNAYPMLYSGELFYADNCVIEAEYPNVSSGAILRGLNSKRAFRLSELAIHPQNGIYKTRYMYRDGKTYTVLYDALTDENIFGVEGDSFMDIQNIGGRAVMTMKRDNPMMTFLYSTENKRVITYSFDGENSLYYLGRFDGRYAVNALSTDGTKTMCWVTPK